MNSDAVLVDASEIHGEVVRLEMLRDVPGRADRWVGVLATL